MRQQGCLEDSLRHHTEHLRLAEAASRSDEMDAAQQNLVQVHSKLAELASEHGDSVAAESYLRACLGAAEACEDEAAQAACHHQLGNLAHKEGRFEEGLSLQQRFLALSSQVRRRQQG
jgi:uncharacterized protein HemY